MTQAVKDRTTLAQATIRFAGDSGDGMQLTGTQFTNTSAVVGNDISTFPDFPAEIRAPAGTVPGVSGFQVHFASQDIHTPGDNPDILVAMNPAALKANIDDSVVKARNWRPYEQSDAKREILSLLAADGFSRPARNRHGSGACGRRR